MTTPRSTSFRPALGFLLGFAAGMADVFFLRAVGISMMVDGVDRTLAVVLFFAINFGVLGAVIGVLIDSRRAIRAQSHVIEEQYGELEETQRELLESRTLAAVGQLSSGVAHEVRNPLGVIRASASMILEDAEPGSDTEDAALFIREEVDRLSGFVTRLLDFTRPLALDLDAFDLDALIARLEMMTSSEEATITIRDVFAEDTLASEVGAPEVDEDLLLSLLLGLVQNASRAAGDEGEVEVLISSGGRDGVILIEVRDDGPGIEEEDLERVFEPFFTTHARGTGLGLAMARKIADAHGATLVALCGQGLGEGGAGACFRLKIGAKPHSLATTPGEKR